MKLRLHQLGWSQSDLARAIDSTPAAVSHVLTKAKHSTLRPAIDAAIGWSPVEENFAATERSIASAGVGTITGDAQLMRAISELNPIFRARLLERALLLLEMQHAEERAATADAEAGQHARDAADFGVVVGLQQEAQRRLNLTREMQQLARSELKDAQNSGDPARIETAEQYVASAARAIEDAEAFLRASSDRAERVQTSMKAVSLDALRRRARESAARVEEIRKEIAAARRASGIG